MRTLIALFLIFITAPAWAQQPPPAPPTIEQRALSVLQAQRNAALDQAANSEIRLQAASEEIAKLKTEIDELKKGIPK